MKTDSTECNSRFGQFTIHDYYQNECVRCKKQNPDKLTASDWHDLENSEGV